MSLPNDQNASKPKTEFNPELLTVLTPVSSDSNSAYIQAFSQALESTDVKNIGLTGSYGSGKSSVLLGLERHLHVDKSNCCGKRVVNAILEKICKLTSSVLLRLERHLQVDKGNCCGKRIVNAILERICKPKEPTWKFLKISLATFYDTHLPTSSTDDDNKPSAQTISADDLNAIEKGIVKQILSQIPPNDLPESQYRRSQKESSVKSWLRSAVVCYILANVLFLQGFMTEPTSIIKTFLPADANFLWLKISNYVLLLAAVLWGVKATFHTITRVGNIKLGLAGNELNFSKPDKTTVLDENLSELIYFFEATKFNLVFIEDLDRFNSTEIFIRLRELNNILNGAQQIGRRIVFVYAVRDDMFEGNERTKFFEFIIPVIPYINPSNAYQLIEKNYSSLGINKDFLNNISIYFDDMRLLQNIFNEFLIFQTRLDSSISKEKLFAIITYKNYYPNDFAKLHKDEGIIFELFTSKKRELIAEKLLGLNAQVEQVETERAAAKKEFFENKDECVKASALEYVNRLTASWLERYSGNSQLFLSNAFQIKLSTEVYTVAQFLQHETFLQALGGKTVEIYPTSHTGYIDKYQNGETEKELLAEINKKLRHIDDKNNGFERFNKEIASLNTQINTIKSMSLQELLAMGNASALSDRDDLEKHLFSYGWIDESYYNYISLFFEGAISQTDKNFAIRVDQNIDTPWETPLGQIETLIDRHLKDKFNKEAILNFSLIHFVYAYKENYKAQISALRTQLAQKTNTGTDFIKRYVVREPLPIHFIRDCISNVDGLWDILKTLPNDQKNPILRDIFAACTINEILKLGQHPLFTDYLARNQDLLSLLPHETGARIERSLEILNELKCDLMQPLKIDNQSQKALFKKIIESNRLGFSVVMLPFALEFEQSELAEKRKVQEGELKEIFQIQPYTTIQKYASAAIKNDVEANISSFVDAVYHSAELYAEDETVFIQLLNNKDLGRKEKSMLIRTHSGVISTLHAIEKIETAQLCLIENKVKPTWDNVIHYFESFESNDATYDGGLTAYLEKNIQTLSATKIMSDDLSEADKTRLTAFEDATLQKIHLSAETFQLFVSAISDPKPHLDLSIYSVEQARCIIKGGLLILSDKNLEKVRASHASLLGVYINANKSEFLNERPDDVTLSQSEYETVLSGQYIDASNKIKIFAKDFPKNFQMSERLALVALNLYGKTEAMPEAIFDQVFSELKKHPTLESFNLIANQVGHQAKENIRLKLEALGLKDAENTEFPNNSHYNNFHSALFEHSYVTAIKSKKNEITFKLRVK
jgi:hypothetical protein